MRGGSGGRTVAGIVTIAAVFAAAGAWPVPDVNEAVYLTKARHAADPAWGRGDFFLETPDAHGVFYTVFGPLAAAMPLEQAAWIGRWAGWLALAAGFWHAVVPLVHTAWGRLVAAAGFSLALRFTTMAGEWVIGGCEAKVFAWALVLAALGEIVRGRYPAAWLLGGLATAFHPIVGGWAMVATMGTALAASKPVTWPRDRVAVALLIAGLAAAAAGVVPALGLSADATAAERAAAHRIYVAERLPHHLLPTTFPAAMVARHVLAVIAWWLLVRCGGERDAAWSRLTAWTWTTLAISCAGMLIAWALPFSPDTAYGLLRFYWFRLADVAVPFALATAAAAVLEDDAMCRLVSPLRPAAIRLAATVLLAADIAVESTHWPLPGRAVTPRGDAKVDAAAWADICDWVRSNTPAEACFLTPRGAASFTWRTDRREVVSWKNSPQDARSLIEWRRRIVDCFAPDGGLTGMHTSTATLGAKRLRDVAARYGAGYAIVPTDIFEPPGPGLAPAVADLPGRQLHANGRYAVFTLDGEAPEASR